MQISAEREIFIRHLHLGYLILYSEFYLVEGGVHF